MFTLIVRVALTPCRVTVTECGPEVMAAGAPALGIVPVNCTFTPVAVAVTFMLAFAGGKLVTVIAPVALPVAATAWAVAFVRVTVAGLIPNVGGTVKNAGMFTLIVSVWEMPPRVTVTV